MADVKVVAPRNIGKGIIWNDSTKQYEVNIGDGLEINSEGKVVVKPLVTNPVATKIVDNGTAQVIGGQYHIDYGNGLIEVNGYFIYPLCTVAGASESKGRFNISCSGTPTNYSSEERLYHKESITIITAAELGMKSILSVNAISGDVYGYRTETPWLVNDGVFSASVTLGVRTLALLNQDQVIVSYVIKGIKA